MQEKGAAHGGAVFRRREHAAIGILEHSLRKPLAFLKEGDWQINLTGYNPMRHGSTGRNPGDHPSRKCRGLEERCLLGKGLVVQLWLDLQFSQNFNFTFGKSTRLLCSQQQRKRISVGE